MKVASSVWPKPSRRKVGANDTTLSSVSGGIQTAVGPSCRGFLGAARQALTKLGVKWEPPEAERDYNAGRSTQVPLNPVVRVKGRFSRRLRDGRQELVLAR